MASKHDLPYKVDALYDVIHILQHRHTIPYHSRPFMWTKDMYINHVVGEILDKFTKNEPYWLGVILLYTGDDIPAISDAQHRLTIVFLMILALSNLLKESNLEYSLELLSWVSMYGRSSVLRKEIPATDNEILTKYGWKRYPNIESCYEYDLEALGNLLNDKEREEGECESLIYDAYETIYNTIKENIDEENYADVAQFMYSSLKVIRICISDWNFAINVFNSFNNIKVAVPSSFLLKNSFAHVMGESRSEEIHNVFESIRAEHKKDFEGYIHLVMNIYCERLITKDEYEKTLTLLITPSTPNPLEKFATIEKKVSAVITSLRSDRFGSIFAKYFSSGHEIYTLCLIPLGVCLFAEGKQKEYFQFVRKLIAFGIRSGKSVSFNRLSYQSFCYDNINKLLSKIITCHTVLENFTTELRKWLGDAAKNKECMDTIVNEKYDGKKFQRVRGILLYLVESVDSHESRMDHSKVHIDHIYPQKPGKKMAPLTNPENKHKIGNFTPFVSIGETEEMKGNIELGNKPFGDKVPHYKLSNIALTRDLAKYESTGFNDSHIESRGVEIAAQIEKCTARDLGL